MLEVLAVRPVYRGHGVASALVQSGVNATQDIGLDIFVHGLKAGLGVYRRAGFELLGEAAYFLEKRAFQEKSAS